MRGNEFLDAIGFIDPALIEKAEVKTKRNTWVKWTAAAASICVIIMGIIAAQTHLNRPINSNLPDETESTDTIFENTGETDTEETGGGKGGYSASAGTSDGITHSYYMGPIFPLTAWEKYDSLGIERRLNLDFSPYKNSDGMIIVNDSYTLTNTADSSQTYSFVYPVMIELSQEENRLPTFKANGEVLDYSITDHRIITADGANSELLNHKRAESWEELAEILNSSTEFDPIAAESEEIPVIIYAFSEYEAEMKTYGGVTHISVNYTADKEKTDVLTLGFSGGSYDEDTGEYEELFTVRQNDTETRYFIVFGEDIENITFESDNRLNRTASVDMERYETDLVSFLEETLDQTVGDEWRYQDYVKVYDKMPDSVKIESVLEVLYRWGVLADEPATRYSCGWFEFTINSSALPQIMYLEFEIEIGAGETVTLSAEMTKDAAVDHFCGGETSHGYDTVTSFFGEMKIQTQYASITGAQYIEIVDQNFGFDPDNGVTEVELSPENEHYRIEVNDKLY